MTKIGPSQEFDFFVTQVVETIEVSKCDHGGNSSTDPPRELQWPGVHTAPEGRKLPTA